jgi:uncharacterized protein YdiU (UPF0061 family)
MSKRLATRLDSSDNSANSSNARKPTHKQWDYSAFDQIDGDHPWQSKVPEGCLLYPTRKLGRGQVLWFNFQLAKDMGLMSADHPHKLTPELNKKIIETFSLQIQNEWDQSNGVTVPPSAMKERHYMATRYLQLQHADKRGRTSGDGRGVWNGSIRHRGTTWDVSSRGTGVTQLSPGAVEAQRPLRTGTEEFGYGCGQADLSELIGSAVFSEIFHRNGLSTERVLAIIDLGRGIGIGVRAAPNLFRPAHLFLWLKQGQRDTLKRAFDYIIQRQCDNNRWSWNPRSLDRHRRALTEIAKSFAKFAAQLERRYIFAWLDWDGDNVLADGGIIDYGSIRQFGLRHDQYRYDDVDRFSTCLNEQRGKARFTVQVFAQLVEFLESGRKLSLSRFTKHDALRLFDREFDLEIRREFLMQLGLDKESATLALSQRKRNVESLYSAFLKLEMTKTRSGTKRLPDGINRPAVFNMRRVLRELPDLVIEEGLSWKLPVETQVLDLMQSCFAKRADLRLSGSLRKKLTNFLNQYISFLRAVLGDRPHSAKIRSWKQRARSQNFEGRITGNGSEYIVEEIIRYRKRGLPLDELRQALELFIASQSPRNPIGTKPTAVSSGAGELFNRLVNISLEHEEDI